MLESPESSGSHIEVVLASLSRRSKRKIGLSRPEVTNLTPSAKFAPNLYIEPKPTLDHRRCRRLPRVHATVYQLISFADVAKPCSETYPRRNRGGRKQI